MVSAEKISEKLIQLDEYMNILSEISETPAEIFLKDKILLGGAKYYLQVSIECCLDIANHVIASERYRAPKDYADSFAVVEENGIISETLGIKLRQMAKFRNRLVHLYGDIDNQYVYQFLNHDLNDITEFRKVITQKFNII